MSSKHGGWPIDKTASSTQEIPDRTTTVAAKKQTALARKAARTAKQDVPRCLITAVMPHKIRSS